MPNGRSFRDVVKERVSFNLARLKKGGQTFEIVIKDPNKALEYKLGKEINMRDILEVEKIFKDAKKGEVQSETNIKKWLNAENTFDAAKTIIRKGELSLTAEQRKKMFEAKRKKLIEYIHLNAADPKTKLPHPVKRIELAMEQAKIQVDPYTPVDVQMQKIIEQLRGILPLSFELMKIKVTIPAKYAGSAYGNLKSKYNLTKESWGNDGSISFNMEAPAGLKADIYNIINKLTNGGAQIEEIK